MLMDWPRRDRLEWTGRCDCWGVHRWRRWMRRIWKKRETDKWDRVHSRLGVALVDAGTAGRAPTSRGINPRLHKEKRKRKKRKSRMATRRWPLHMPLRTGSGDGVSDG